MKCVFTSSRSNGVYCHGAGCTLSECVIKDNALPGIAICDGANPIISHCSISDGRNAGILVFDDGKGVIVDCEIQGCYSLLLYIVDLY